MDYVLLGIDGIILGLCIRDFISFKNTTKALQGAQELSINENLKQLVGKQPDQKINYAIVRGTVRPIGSSIKSIMTTPSVSGVIQIIKLSEHRIARGFAGFWIEQNKLMHVSANEVPFTIANDRTAVEIIDGLSAEVLDLDIIHDSYEPSNLSFFDYIFGFFTGIRQRGIQTTEEMLRDGSFITAVGELEMDENCLRLQSSSVGPLILSTATKKALIKKYNEAKNDSFFKCLLFGTISVIILTIIVRKYYMKRKQLKQDQKIADRLEETRRERRARLRPTNLSEEQLCVVCLTNPKEIICIPCGHVCMCEDCSKNIRFSCPVCRNKIESKSAAFIV